MIGKKKGFFSQPDGRNYMQLGIAGCFPVEPQRGFCGLRTLLSAPKPQLTYSFCYGVVLYFSKYFSSPLIQPRYKSIPELNVLHLNISLTFGFLSGLKRLTKPT